MTDEEFNFVYEDVLSIIRSKNSYLRLFECREDIRKLEYLINKYN